MLILTRKTQQTITVGNDIKIHVIEVRGKQVRLGIEAPKELKIVREELLEADAAAAIKPSAVA